MSLKQSFVLYTLVFILIATLISVLLLELYSKLQEGLADIDAGNTRPFADVMADLRHRRERR